ncbi:MAG: hypothetical protein ACREEP_09450 [Dongiaceae bacterium]
MAEIDLVFDPDNFVGGNITDPNRFFPLVQGNEWVYEEVDGLIVTESVTGETKNILGVNCTVVTVTEREDGRLLERTKDYYAQDVAGNVWYLGEDSRARLEDGGWTTEGTWRAGVDDAVPGIIMLANPQIGDMYDQEGAIGVAEDRAEVLSLTESVTVPFGSFANCLLTEDINPLTGDIERKFLAPDIGLVLTQGITEGGAEELVSFTTKDKGTVNLQSLVQSMASFGKQSGISPTLAPNGRDDPGLQAMLTAGHDGRA